MSKTKKNNIQGTKLIQLLNTLSLLELKRFKHFLESPFHNTNQYLLQLFLLLKKHHPNYDAPNLTKEAIFKKLFGKKPYRPQRMNDLIYDLRKLVEDFLIVSDNLDDKQERQNALVNVLSKRNHPFFIEESKKIIKHIESKPTYLTGTDYLQLQQIYDQWWFHVDTEKNKNEALEFKAAHENLDLFYVTTKLQYIAEQKWRKKIFQESENLDFQEAVFSFAERNKETKPILFFLQRIIQLTNTTLKEKDYFLLKEQIISNGTKIEIILRRDLLNHLVNYCIQKNNRGWNEFLKEALHIYKIMLHENLLVLDGKISHVHFLNISNFANKCGELEWAKNFRETYTCYLDENRAEEILNVANIYTFICHKNFHAANELMNANKLHSNTAYYVGIRVHLMKGLYNDWVNFNINNSETLLNQSIAFEQYIKRNKSFSEEKNKSYLQFARFFKQLVKLRRTQYISLNSLKKLKYEIEKANFLSFKDWLTEEVQKLKKQAIQ